MRPLLPLLIVLAALAAPAAAKPEAPADFPAPAPDKPAAPGAEAVSTEPGPGEQAEALLGWLTGFGLPSWAWGLLALLGFLLLRRLFRRAGRDDDLMGPPRPDRYRNLPRH